jgi:hypothetical protein
VQAVKLLVALAATALLLGGSAEPAAAGGTLTTLPDRVNPIEHQVAGPAFAGEGVAYAVPVGRSGYSVRIQRPDGTTSSQLVKAKGGGALGQGEAVADDLAASPQVVALSHEYVICGGECRYSDWQPIESAVFGGALGGSLGFRGCGNYFFPSGVDASGSEIAYLDLCADGAVVHDPTGPGAASRVFPADLFEGGDVRIAGRYLAVDTPDTGEFTRTITVYDWQSGDVVYKVKSENGGLGLASYDIADDGTLAFSGQGERGPGTFWASPQDPTAHLVAGEPGQPRIADGKIAVSWNGVYEVFALDGTKLAATSSRDRIGGFDFDGKRVAYVAQPCVVSAVVTWDLSGAPPAMPAGKCPAARAASTKGVVDLKRRRVELSVRCPARPALGCAAEWEAELNSRPAVHTRYVDAALLPGEKRTLRLGLSRKAACRLARHPATRALIDLGSFHSYSGRAAEESRKARFKLRTTGRARDCS